MPPSQEPPPETSDHGSKLPMRLKLSKPALIVASLLTAVVGLAIVIWALAAYPAPTSLKPGNNTTHDTTPTLTWSAAGYNNFKLQVVDKAANPSFDKTKAFEVNGAVVGTSCSPTTSPCKTLAAGKTYSWRVKVKQVGDKGLWSAVKSFTINPTQPPTQPNFPLTLAGCLARANKTTVPNLTGSQQFRVDDTQKVDWTYDATNSSAQFGAGTINPYSIGKYQAPPRPCWIGGKAVGQQSRNLTWKDMHDGGFDGSALRIAARDWMLVDGLRADNVEDGLDPRGPEDTPGQGGTFYVRNTYMTYIRDDCIENDHIRSGYVYDSLFDGCYTGLSEQAGTGVTQAGDTWTIDNVLLRLQQMPGPYGADDPSIFGHGNFFKWQNGIYTKLVVKNSIFMAEHKKYNGSNFDFPAGMVAENNTIVWLGSGAFPGNPPAGFTVTTNRSVWDNARALWLSRHGCTSFDNCTKLTNPDPL